MEAMDWPAVRIWRKAVRAKAIAARVAVPATLRDHWTKALIAELRPILLHAPQPISFYWPLKAEPDLRPLMRELDDFGIEICLPVALRLGEPMTFRPWNRGMAMTRGIWNIPIPATEKEVTPRSLIAPFVAFDDKYRLGYGGGFFDRTLEKIGAAARPIGIGFSMFHVPTIHPQPHDIPMRRIVTEQGEEPKTDGRDLNAPSDVTQALAALMPGLPEELKPLADFVHWRLGGEVAEPAAQLAPGQAETMLRQAAVSHDRPVPYQMALRALLAGIDRFAAINRA
ncbi:5-formyltetrahydrofolate cyclo-ligase [Dongia soli]|uniref:5-formyltetrahydrofolate cyclo-ligase n=1 Tax=Dongia soli TaxID=600628 RepID=A0ABU5EFW6_9PROT|nr:5-formyltetrahydrofolate cyclo-ligase [Dongia soli]MDY0884797.1 5-formyltetrahydrofolate cyclo-ligase [Dongia soli]